MDAGEWPFRLALIIGIVVVMPIGLYHRLRSQATRERLNRRAEGWFILLTLRPAAAAGILALLAYVVSPASMAWSSLPLPSWLRWSGVGLGVIAGAMLISVYRTLDRNLTDTVVTRVKHTLVTSGPYRWVRHPFYVSLGLAVVANSLTTANWFFAASSAVAVLLLVVRTATEEQKLIERFGDAYTGYMSHTGRFFPRLR